MCRCMIFLRYCLQVRAPGPSINQVNHNNIILYKTEITKTIDLYSSEIERQTDK